MSTIYWRGDAVAVKQVSTITVSGTWATNDTATLTINGKSITFTVGATQTIAAVVAGLVAAWNNSTILEFMEVTAADASPYITLTADTAGMPFTVTTSETTAGDGELSDPAATVANAGPESAATAANYSGGALPTDGDTLVFERSSKNCIYDLEALAALTTLTVKVKRSYTGRLRLPSWHAVGSSGYWEYRPRYFKAGLTALEIGDGTGNGSGAMGFDAASSNPAVTVSYTANSTETGVPPLLIKATGATSTLSVRKGNVGVALFAGETAAFATATVGYSENQSSDSVVTFGSGVTLTTVNQTGGTIEIASNVTTFNQDSGKATFSGAAAITTATIDGTVYDNSTGTWTTVSIGDTGVYDRRQATGSKTITNAIPIEDKGSYHDPYSTVTASGGWTCDPEKCTLNIGRVTLAV